VSELSRENVFGFSLRVPLFFFSLFLFCFKSIFLPSKLAREELQLWGKDPQEANNNNFEGEKNFLSQRQNRNFPSSGNGKFLFIKLEGILRERSSEGFLERILPFF
jgi:hypothetical protein